MSETTTNEVAVPQKKAITVNEVLQCLKEGLDRKQIGAKYGLKAFEVAAMFKHPKLKNKKVIKPKEFSFELLDEEGEEQIHDGGPLAEATGEPEVESAGAFA